MIGTLREEHLKSFDCHPSQAPMSSLEEFYDHSAIAPRFISHDNKVVSIHGYLNYRPDGSLLAYLHTDKSVLRNNLPALRTMIRHIKNDLRVVSANHRAIYAEIQCEYRKLYELMGFRHTGYKKLFYFSA